MYCVVDVTEISKSQIRDALFAIARENTTQFPKLKPKFEGWQNGAMQQQFVRQGHNTVQPSDIKCI